MLRPRTATDWARPRNSDRAGMAFVSGGTFPMRSDGLYLEEASAHCVSVSLFWIHRIPVRPFGPPSSLSGPNEHPVVLVARDPKGYARWDGKELPTEVDFECAARGGPKAASYDPAPPIIEILCKKLKEAPHLCVFNYCRHHRPTARYSDSVDTSTNHFSFRRVMRETRSAR